MKYLFIINLLLFSIASIAGRVSIDWGYQKNSSSLFFSKEEDIIKVKNDNNTLEKTTNAKDVKTTSIISQNQVNSTNNNSFISIIGGCIPRNDDKEWSCVDDFKISAYEITNLEYKKFNTKHNSGKGFNADNKPVVNINIEDINKYINWLNSQSSGKYRLPTKNEWLYAALAGNSSFEKKDCNSANIKDCNANTVAVGSYAANNWGLYDTQGNVFEITQGKLLAGGSFMNDKKEYKGAANDVGFRLVLEK